MNLSFCIPTFNRLKTLKETLASIIKQMDKSVEVVICDNCSLDGTQEYVESLLLKHENITYYRWSKQVPCGCNLLKSVDIASGDYCWLLTDDDVLEACALEKVKKILAEYQNLEGISVNAEGYDKSLTRKKRIRYSHNMKESKLFLSFEDCYESLGAWFGCWSVQIIKKDSWHKALWNKEYEKYTGYHHLFLIHEMIRNKPRWYFLNEKCVGYRADNESFSKEYGKYQRYKIDLVTYRGIGDYFFGYKSERVRKVCRQVLNSYSFWQIISMKVERTSFYTLLKIALISFKYYVLYTAFWVKILPAIFLPRRLILFAKYIYRRCYKNESHLNDSNTHIQQS